jgi:thiamine monophosphate kinase
MGWGNTETGGSNSDVLRHAFMQVVDNKQCKIDLEDNKLSNNVLCAYSEGQDACQVSRITNGHGETFYLIPLADLRLI